MTEQQAREMLDEHRADWPRKRVGRSVYELRGDGRLNVYTLTKSGKRMVFSHTANPEDCIHPDVRAWLNWRSR